MDYRLCGRLLITSTQYEVIPIAVLLFQFVYDSRFPRWSDSYFNRTAKRSFLTPCAWGKLKTVSSQSPSMSSVVLLLLLFQMLCYGWLTVIKNTLTPRLCIIVVQTIYTHLAFIFCVDDDDDNGDMDQVQLSRQGGGHSALALLLAISCEGCPRRREYLG